MEPQERKKCCVLFAGQSVQETGMCAELWKNPAAREILERLEPSLGADLEEVTTRMPEAELALTFNAQRAIHAHHLGNWFAYKAARPGLELDGAIGHSMGIAAALVAAGAMSVEDSGVFMRARAQAFSDACKAFREPMGLAAIMADGFIGDYADRIDSFPGVSLALHNTITKGTAGGTLAALQAFAAHAEAQGWPLRTKVLKVEGPYHTKAFASCRAPLMEAVSRIRLSAPKAPVFMGTSGGLETDPAEIGRLLAEQPFTREKHFDAVWAAYDHGCRNFLEVGHRPQPVTWIREQLQDEDGALMEGVCALAVRTGEIALSPAP